VDITHPDSRDEIISKHFVLSENRGWIADTTKQRSTFMMRLGFVIGFHQFTLSGLDFEHLKKIDDHGPDTI